MIDFETLSPDAPAIILLCSSIGSDRGSAARPLGPRTWAKLSARVGHASELVGLTAEAIDRSLAVGLDEAERIASLLARAGQLAFELDRLRSRGIWVVTVADEAYPARLIDRLGPDSPPVLFGSGDRGRPRSGRHRDRRLARRRRRSGGLHGASRDCDSAWRGRGRVRGRARDRCDRHAGRVRRRWARGRRPARGCRTAPARGRYAGRRRLRAGRPGLAVPPDGRIQCRCRDGPQQDHLWAVGCRRRRQHAPQARAEPGPARSRPSRVTGCPSSFGMAEASPTATST